MQELYFTIQNKTDLILFSSWHVNIKYYKLRVQLFFFIELCVGFNDSYWVA
jgi:hypothetical protein